jgi:hypothetical protein
MFNLDRGQAVVETEEGDSKERSTPIGKYLTP